MFIQKKFKDNKLFSCRIICSGRDASTGMHKNYTKTWRVPSYLTTKKEVEFELKKIEVEFEKEVDELSNGIIKTEDHTMFKDLALEWLNGILARNSQSYTYYTRAKGDLEVIIPFFEKFQIKQMSALEIQRFYDYLGKRTYTKEIVTTKNTLKKYIDILFETSGTMLDIDRLIDTCVYRGKQ